MWIKPCAAILYQLLTIKKPTKCLIMLYARSDGLCFGLRQAITAQLFLMWGFLRGSE
jgi:hypothetical protein